MFQIESNIPLPEKKTANDKYPFKDMKVGDSFFVPGADTVPAILRGRLYASCSNRRQASGKTERFSVRIETNGHGEGVRVWRTA